MTFFKIDNYAIQRLRKRQLSLLLNYHTLFSLSLYLGSILLADQIDSLSFSSVLNLCIISHSGLGCLPLCVSIRIPESLWNKDFHHIFLEFCSWHSFIDERILKNDIKPLLESLQRTSPEVGVLSQWSVSKMGANHLCHQGKDISYCAMKLLTLSLFLRKILCVS